MARALGDEGSTIVVIGAGVIGLAIAFRLVREYEDVLLIDRAEPGMGCSFGNVGHIATEQIFPLASPSTVVNAPRLFMRRDRPLSVRRQYALRILPWLARFIWASRRSAFADGTAALASLQCVAMESLHELCTDADIASLLHRRGHLILVENERSVAAAKRQLHALAAHNVAVEWRSPNQVGALVPELKKGIAGGIYAAGTGHVSDPFKVCEGLFDAFAAAGGRFLKEEVRAVESGSGGRFELVLTDGKVTSQRVVIAAGAWSRSLALQTGFDVPLETERGYHVTAQGWHGAFDIAIASFERMIIMTPLEPGLRVTGFVEFGGLELPPAPARFATLKQHLRELLPDADMPNQSEWMGFRPSLCDHLPVISRCPDNENLLYAFGHQHLGLTLAGVTADAILSLIAGREASVDLRPFRIDRF